MCGAKTPLILHLKTIRNEWIASRPSGLNPGGKAPPVPVNMRLIKSLRLAQLTELWVTACLQHYEYDLISSRSNIENLNNISEY
jgi:hypothetical protein